MTPRGNIQINQADTTPGSNGPLAPPAGWTGDSSEYRQMVRQHWNLDPGMREVLACMARRGLEVTITGPYAAEAREILEGIQRTYGRGRVDAG